MDATTKYLQGELYKLQKLVWCMKQDVDYIKANCCGDVPPPEPCVGPTIGTQPADYSGDSGVQFTLSVIATGDATLHYQWYKNGVAIVGATSASYTVAEPDEDDSGNYNVYINNSCNSVLSDTAVVSIEPVVVHFTAYWGWVDSIDDIATEEDILSLQGSGSFVHNADVVADFTANSSPKILVMFQPSTEVGKTVWYGNSLNNGNIGGDEDLFQITTSITGWEGYYTAYPTVQTQTTIQFKEN